MGKFSIADVVRQAAGDMAPEVSGEIVQIPMDKITANDKNFYVMSELEELAASIELTGLIHPIVVRRDGDGYILVDGERRYRAMTLLEWPDCPAIVRTPVNDVVEELMLIEANRTQRRLSDAELAQQAERYTELLSRLRESGVEIPGRLRDRVAEAMQVSASKLARLHKIQTSLVEPLAEKFRAGELKESTAYELAQLPEERQRLFAEKKTAKLTAAGVTNKIRPECDVWAVTRYTDGTAYRVFRYVCVAVLHGYVICCSRDDHGEISVPTILHMAETETRIQAFACAFSVFPAGDVYAAEDEAEAALRDEETGA